MKTVKLTNRLGQTVEVQMPETPEEWEQRRREVGTRQSFYGVMEDGLSEDE